MRVAKIGYNGRSMAGKGAGRTAGPLAVDKGLLLVVGVAKFELLEPVLRSETSNLHFSARNTLRT